MGRDDPGGRRRDVGREVRRQSRPAPSCGPSPAGWCSAPSASGLAHYIEQFTGHYVAFRLLAMLRNDFYKRLEPLAPAGMGTLRTGDAISRVINDCERVEPFYAHTIAPAICAIIVPASLLGWLYAINPAFAWTLLPFMLFMIIVLPTLIAVIGGSGDADWRRVQGEVNAFLTDSFQGLRDTLAFGAGQRRRQEARRLGEELGRGPGEADPGRCLPEGRHRVRGGRRGGRHAVGGPGPGAGRCRRRPAGPAGRVRHRRDELRGRDRPEQRDQRLPGVHRLRRPAVRAHGPGAGREGPGEGPRRQAHARPVLRQRAVRLPGTATPS